DGSYGLQADGDHLSDQADDVLRIVGAIWIVGDAASFVGRDLILIDDPFECGAIAEAIVVGFFRDSGEREELVVDERGFVFAEPHFGNVPVQLFSSLLGFGERILELLLVVDVYVRQPLAGFRETSETVYERDAGELAAEVGGVALAVT